MLRLTAPFGMTQCTQTPTITPTHTQTQKGEFKMLTRKDFKELADILREHKANGVLVRDIADFCYNSNSNFDRGRFYHACELEL
jgi:hypothetical protein